MSEERIDNAFSESGTLYQVEYALEGAKKGMSCVVVLGDAGIAMAASKRVPEKLMDPSYITSFFSIGPNTVGVISGYPMDVQDTAMKMKKKFNDLEYELGQLCPPDILARHMSDGFQILTQENSRRLTAVNVAIAGYDRGKSALYHTDSSGVLFPYRGVAFGEGAAVMTKKLERIYKKNTTNEEILEIALETLTEALGTDYLATNVELAILTEGHSLRRIATDEIDSLLVRIAEKD